MGCQYSHDYFSQGSGIQRIKRTCIDQGLAEPRIRGKGDFVDVEFYRPVAESAKEVLDIDGLPADILTPQEQIIMQHLNQHPTITVKVACGLFTVKDSHAREILKEMTDKSLLTKRGNSRSAFSVKA